MPAESNGEDPSGRPSEDDSHLLILGRAVACRQEVAQGRHPIRRGATRRDAFLRAAAVVVRHGAERRGRAAVTRPVRRVLDDGVRDGQTLADTADGASAPRLEGGVALVGRMTFEAQPQGCGIDEDFGMRRGANRHIRISLRCRAGSDLGVVNACRSTWGEYTALADPVRGDVVRATYREALDRSPRLGPEDFISLLHAGAAGRTTPGQVPDVGATR
jgi:hypothetical protein